MLEESTTIRSLYTGQMHYLSKKTHSLVNRKLYKEIRSEEECIHLIVPDPIKQMF